jgi:signal transduction histidine kinase
MFQKKQFQRFILGDNSDFTEIERSRLIFAAATIVVGIFISLFFLAYDLYLGYSISLYIYIPFILIFGLSLYFLKSRKFVWGINTFLIALNLFVYVVMSSIPEDSMSALFYITIIVAEYVLLGQDQKLRASLLIILSILLYCLDAFGNFSILPIRDYDESTLEANKIIDFIIGVGGILMSIKLLIDYQQRLITETDKKNEELNQVNKELDRYSYTITHDLKGPIISVMRMLEMSISDSSNFKEYSTPMKESLHNIMKLINDVTELTRNKNIEVSKQEFNVSQLIHSIWELLKYAPEAQDIEFKVELDKDLNLSTDKVRLVGIINNLITNAIKYHDNTKKNKFINVSGTVENSVFLLCIEDNGIGIEPQFQQKVFEMFYRASNIEGGSGLGLFNVKESLEKLSGEIALESEFGKGTTFNISIPLNNHTI